MILVLLYLMAAVLANLSVAYFGPIMIPINSFFLIGLSITTRDGLHEIWKGKYLYIKMTALMGTGSLITYFLNSSAAQVAIASFIAFFLSGITDTIVYQLFIKRHKLIKINVSNAASAFVDSVIFPTLAFGTFLPGIIITQYVIKMAGGFVWSLILSKKIGKVEKQEHV